MLYTFKFRYKEECFYGDVVLFYFFITDIVYKDYNQTIADITLDYTTDIGDVVNAYTACWFPD